MRIHPALLICIAVFVIVINYSDMKQGLVELYQDITNYDAK